MVVGLVVGVEVVPAAVVEVVQVNAELHTSVLANRPAVAAHGGPPMFVQSPSRKMTSPICSNDGRVVVNYVFLALPMLRRLSNPTITGKAYFVATRCSFYDCATSSIGCLASIHDTSPLTAPKSQETHSLLIQ